MLELASRSNGLVTDRYTFNSFCTTASKGFMKEEPREITVK